MQAISTKRMRFDRNVIEAIKKPPFGMANGCRMKKPVAKPPMYRVNPSLASEVVLIVKTVDGVSHMPLSGVEFRIRFTQGQFLDADSSRLSCNGRYTTDMSGEIRVLGFVGTLRVEVFNTPKGYAIDEKEKKQDVTVGLKDRRELTITVYPSNAPTS